MASTYDRLYRNDAGEFDSDFIRLCESNFSMTPAGAKKHYETLVNHLPSGYTYHGKTTRSHAQKFYSDTSMYIIIDNITLYDLVGNPLSSEYVLLGKKI